MCCQLSGLADDVHTLLVESHDRANHTEASPYTYTWRVDTVPPIGAATLLSRSLSNADVVVVNVSCAGEVYPCTYCWQMAVDVRATAHSVTASDVFEWLCFDCFRSPIT